MNWKPSALLDTMKSVGSECVGWTITPSDDSILTMCSCPHKTMTQALPSVSVKPDVRPTIAPFSIMYAETFCPASGVVKSSP